MRQKLRNMLPAHGVVAGGTAKAEIITPEPMKIHGIRAIYKSDNAGTVERRPRATMEAELGKFKLYLMNKLQRQPTVTQIFEDFDMRSQPIKDGIINMAFSRDERELSVERDSTALFSGVGDVIRVELEIDGAATAPDVEFELDVEPFNSNSHDGSLNDIIDRRGGQRQLIETIRSDTVNVTKTGELSINLTGEGRDLSCVKLRTTNCDYIEVYRGVDLKWEGTPADFDRWLEEGGYSPQAGVIVFSPEFWGGGRIADWYQYRGKQLIIKPNMTAATSFDIDIHEIGDAVR